MQERGVAQKEQSCQGKWLDGESWDEGHIRKWKALCSGLVQQWFSFRREDFEVDKQNRMHCNRVW